MVEEDKLLEAALDVGAEDVNADGEFSNLTVTTHDQFSAIAKVSLQKQAGTPIPRKAQLFPDPTIYIYHGGLAAPANHAAKHLMKMMARSVCLPESRSPSPLSRRSQAGSFA